MDVHGEPRPDDGDSVPRLTPQDLDRLAHHDRELAADRRLTRLTRQLAASSGTSARTAVLATVLLAILVVVVVTSIAISAMRPDPDPLPQVPVVSSISSR